MSQCSDYIALLKSGDNEIVRDAAFRAGEDMCLEAVPMLAELLAGNHLGIQEAAESSLRRIGGKETVAAVLPLLRSEDAPVRNLSMDILRGVGKQDLPALIALLHDEDPDIRIFISDILGSCDSLVAVQPLCEALLKDPEVNVRYQAAVSLGSLGREEAAECLNKAMEDEEWVQYSVIEALKKLKHSSSVDALVRALDRASDLVASMIIDALGEMGNIKAVTMLLKRVDTSPTALRNKIIKAVVNILGGKSLTLLTPEERERFRQYLLVALRDEDEEIQDAAILGLAFVGAEQASQEILNIAATIDPEEDMERLDKTLDALGRIGLTDALKNGIQDGNAVVSTLAVQAMGAAATHGADSEEVVSVIKDCFWDVDQEPQRMMMEVLTSVESDSCTDFVVDILRKHQDGGVLKSALSFVGNCICTLEIVEIMFDLLEHPYDDVKESALEALVVMDDPEVAYRFMQTVDSEDFMTRLIATYALGKIGGEGVREVLVKALSDPEADIRKVGVEALGESVESPDELAEILMPVMDDESKDVRLAVIESMGANYDEMFLPYLLGALADGDDWVRIRAIDALGEYAGEAAVPKLIELLETPNRFEVMKVVEALGNIGGTNAFRALLSLSDNEDYELARAAEEAIVRIQESQEL